jgi:hypothetical protein
MSWLRKRVVPQMYQILMLLFIVAITGDDLVIQRAFLKSDPALKQAVCNEDPDDAGCHVWKLHQYPLKIEDDAQLSHLVIRRYLDQFNGHLILTSPSMFFQPDRAPPDSFQHGIFS